MIKIRLRSISILIYFTIFILSLAGVLCFDNLNFSIYNFDFSYNKINASIMFLANLVLFLFIFSSKNSVRKKQKVFYISSLILTILFNLIAISDNFFVIFFLLFLMFLINYFINNSKTQLLYDIIALFVSFLFVSWGLLRYFALNDLALSFSNLSHYLYKVDSFSLNIALCGFLIPLLRLFNLLPFTVKNESSFTEGYNSIINYGIGSLFLIKLFLLFNYEIYNNQSLIIIFLLFNMMYFTIIQFKSKSIKDFLRLIMSTDIIISIFTLFLYDENGLISYIYYSMVIIITYGGGYLLCDLLEKNMGNVDFDKLKKMPKNNLAIVLLIFTIFMNIAKLPLFAGFFAFTQGIFNILNISSSGKIVAISPYILIVCAFLTSFNTIKVISRVLIKPLKPLKYFIFHRRQAFALSVICVILLLYGIGIQYITEQFVNIIETGSF